MKYFKISNIHFALDCFQNINITKEFQSFITLDPAHDWKFRYIKQDILPKQTGIVLYRSLDDIVLKQDQAYTRIFINRDCNELPYAMTSIDFQTKQVIIQVLKGNEKFFSEMGNCLYHSCWERVLIEEGRLLLHASCVETTYGGILFSGESGIGKSTQSDLWVQYENAEIINGDRPILSKDIAWKAWGSPYAGSSNIHKNKSCNIRCIVILKQDSKCTIRRLKGLEAFHKVYAGTTVYRYDKSFSEKAINMVTDLVSELPIYELSCTPDQDAVNILKGELEKLDD